MASDTLIQSGKFVADGSSKVLTFREDVDWIRVYNYTQAATQQTTGRYVEFLWLRGMTNPYCFGYQKSNSTDVLNMDITSGMKIFDTAADPVGTLDTTVTAVSADAVPRVTVTSTAGLVDNDIVRMINISGAQQLGGIDFSIGVFDATHFDLAYMAQIVAGTTGSYRIIKYDPIFYPRRRYICKITQATQAVVSMTVGHQFTVGQEVRFIVPDDYGMKEINGMTGTITAVSTVLASNVNTITVDINTSGFTAFAFPLTAAAPFTHAQVVPVGADPGQVMTSSIPETYAETRNNAALGVEFWTGVNYPGGSSGDTIYWSAGKSVLVTNE